jgi:UDP-glucose 4-epimerase
MVRPGSTLDRFQDVAEHPQLTLLRAELAHRRVWAPAVARFAPEAVLHLAWQGTGSADRENPVQVENVAWTVSLLREAAASGARRFVGVGSQAEYGPQNHAVDEGAPTRPTSLYGAAKLAAGLLTLALSQRVAVAAAWVRLFSVYGPGEKGTLLADLTEALRSGRELPLTECEQLWDYLFVEDAAEALVLLAADSTATGIYNLGSGRVVRLKDVVSRVSRELSPRTPMVFGARPYPPDQVMHLQADIRRLTETTGWKPRTDLDDGLHRLLRPTASESRLS